MINLGDFTEDAVIDFKFHTHKEDGTPITLAGSPALAVYKSNGVVESTAGITLTVDFDSRTGMHHVRVDTSSNAFYTASNSYQVVITSGTVDGKSVVGYVIAQFSIQDRYLSTVKTVVDAIKAVTDVIPDSGAMTSIAQDSTVAKEAQATTNKNDIITEVNTNETKIDTVKVDTAAIKLKTDNLPSDPASETNVNANETKIDAVKVDTVAIKLKTDDLTFSSANKLDTNVKAIDEQNTNGNNATLKLKQLDVQNSGGDAVIAKSTGANGNGINATGNGNGRGVRLNGGLTGHGLDVRAGASGGKGMFIESLTDTAAFFDGFKDGIFAQGVDNGMNLNGIGSAPDINAAEISGIKSKTDNLPTDPASETNVDSNEAKIDIIDTVVDTIKVVTDNLPNNGALNDLATILSEVQNGTYGLAAIQTLIGALNNISVTDIFTTTVTESYSTKGATKTLAQLLYELRQFFMEFSFTPAGKRIVLKLDQIATAKEYQLDNASTPTANTEVT